MKRLSKDISNAGIMILEMNVQEYEAYSKKMMTALRKFGSGKKTRAVHKLLAKKSPAPAIFAGQAANALVSPNTKETTLHSIMLNMYHFDDTLGGKGSVAIATEIFNTDKKIRKEETFVNDARLLNIEKLKENKEELTEKLFNSYDYIAMVDGVYFGWLLALAKVSVMNDSATKAKIVTTASDILATILKNLYQKTNNKLEGETHQLIEAIAIYFVRIYYYGETASYVLNKLKTAFSEDIVETIQRSKVTKINQFNELALILKETELLPITQNTFDMQMTKMFGKLAYEEYIQPSLVSYIAFMANMASPSSLFKDSFPIDQELHERLEELILNEQKRVTIRERAL